MKHCLDCARPPYSPHAARCTEHAEAARHAQQIAYNRGKRKRDTEKRRALEAEVKASLSPATEPRKGRPEPWEKRRQKILACVEPGSKRYRPRG